MYCCRAITVSDTVERETAEEKDRGGRKRKEEAIETRWARAGAGARA